ncbi:hypothetical protein [Paenibacillus sp. NPDC058071]|uniref:YphA family membrane protein n=1 Tax=Paenibacillus sp. NPDC058071 TaxID=3346326 RepID=UPI0036DA340D
MNDGFLTLWIVTIAIILLVTGWSVQVGAGRHWPQLAAAAVACLLLQTLGGSFEAGSVHIDIKASAVFVMLGALAAMRMQRLIESSAYLLVGTLLTGMIWGSLQMMYSADPVFYLIHPRWDAPIAGGMLAAAFSVRPGQQFAVLAFGAACAEVIHALLSGGAYLAAIGSLAWWDGFWLAFATARISGLSFAAVRSATVRVGTLLWGRRRGGQSE